MFYLNCLIEVIVYDQMVDQALLRHFCGRPYPKKNRCRFLLMSLFHCREREKERELCNVAECEHHVYGPGLLFLMLFLYAIEMANLKGCTFPILLLALFIVD